MIFWMTNPDHGTTAAYDTGERDRLVTLGWSLLNYGDSPNLPPKVKPTPAEAECKAALAESIRLDPPPVEAPKRKPGRPAKAK